MVCIAETAVFPAFAPAPLAPRAPQRLDSLLPAVLARYDLGSAGAEHADDVSSERVSADVMEPVAFGAGI